MFWYRKRCIDAAGMCPRLVQKGTHFSERRRDVGEEGEKKKERKKREIYKIQTTKMKRFQ